MKYFEIQYWLPNQSKLFSKPQFVIACSLDEKRNLLKKIEELGYTLKQVEEFDPADIEDVSMREVEMLCKRRR